MPVQAFIIMTGAERAAAEQLDNSNDDGIYIGGRAIDNVLANSLGYDVLVGKFVVAARALNDAEYAKYLPVLSGLPIRVLDSDTLFLPVIAEGDV